MVTLRCLSRRGDLLLLTGVKGYLPLSEQHNHPILNEGAIYGLFNLVLWSVFSNILKSLHSGSKKEFKVHTKEVWALTGQWHQLWGTKSAAGREYTSLNLTLPHSQQYGPPYAFSAKANYFSILQKYFSMTLRNLMFSIGCQNYFGKKKCK